MRLLPLLALLAVGPLAAQQIHYSGTTLSDPYQPGGGLVPVIGVRNQQIMRAQRDVASATSTGWTYNHQPMMAWWQGRLWVHYLSDPRSEHVPGSKTFVQSSADGITWSAPEVLFPEYDVPAVLPDGRDSIKQAEALRTGRELYQREGLKAIMHQRVGWYVSSAATGRKLIALGHYGICLHAKDDPNDGNGIGRVVREVHPDGTMGEVFFLYYNHGFGEHNTSLRHYSRSRDRRFRQACDEILRNPHYWMQMVEECDLDDARLPVANPYKAFCWYTLPDGQTEVALWKHALSSWSHDGGATWKLPALRAPGFVNSNAKIWGQRLTDGTYATVYNPAEFRWPLAISLSADGLDYTTLHLVHGEMTPMRYGGNYKSYGPQYVRGILPGNGLSMPLPTIVDKEGGQGGGKPVDNAVDNATPDSALWVTYSFNKEDIWVSRIPVPVRTQATSWAEPWNVYSPVWAPVDISVDNATGTEVIHLSDRDPFDYAKVERMLPPSRRVRVTMDVTPRQSDRGRLEVELCDAQGRACTRLAWQADGTLAIKVGARWNGLLDAYRAGQTYRLAIEADLDRRMVTLSIDGRRIGPKMLYAPLDAIARLTLRTGERRTSPTPEDPADRDWDLPGADAVDPEAAWDVASVCCEPLPDPAEAAAAASGSGPASDRLGTTGGGPAAAGGASEPGAAALPPMPVTHMPAGLTSARPALLRWQDYAHYADAFHDMGPEGIVQAIADSEAAAWMERNVPLFECPDPQVTEMWYFRWWSLRKHLKQTPVGWGMTEFLVSRSYADRYNLIACALGHHVMETRWLRDGQYADGIVATWLRGNDGGPMAKLDKFSSWLPYAMWQRSLVTGDTAWWAAYRPDLVADMERWQASNAYGDGLYWQRDVSDGMEEQISGGRRVKNRRPTINAYVAASRRVLGLADSIDLDRLWDPAMQFYGTLTQSDSIAQVRELIGYLPWYFNLPADDSARFRAAWMQLLDADGFDAPMGMTTAERRHPKFRKFWKGYPTCEWDGAVWPFATAQTLTALANVEANYPQLGAALPDTLFWHHLRKYTESQHYRGHPYVGEYMDERTGYWMMGDRERSRFYNHSTYCDLIITGLCGFRPDRSWIGSASGTGQAESRESLISSGIGQAGIGSTTGAPAITRVDLRQTAGTPAVILAGAGGSDATSPLDGLIALQSAVPSRASQGGAQPSAMGQDVAGCHIEVHPLAPTAWDWWCVDGLLYRGHILTILFDRDGTHYRQGRGLVVMIDGQRQSVGQ